MAFVPVEQASSVDLQGSMRPLHNGQNPVPAGKLELRHQDPVADSATFTTPEGSEEDLGDLLLEVLPPDGSTMGNLSARESLSRAAERPISDRKRRGWDSI